MAVGRTNAGKRNGGGGGSVVIWDELDAAGGTIRHIEAASVYSDGDNLSYGTASLAGTTWYFNDTLDFTGLPEATYDLAFVSNNTSCVDLVYMVADFGVETEELLFSPSPGIAYSYPSPMPPFYPDGWQNQAYRTISITGGTDATNPVLIAWLQANATEVTS